MEENVLVITQVNKGFVVELNGQRLNVLNQKALDWHLKHVAGFDKAAISSINACLCLEPSVSIRLEDTVRKVG